MTMDVTCLQKWDTEYSADSAEFCPIEKYCNLLAIGTYQLVDQEEQNVNSSEKVVDLPKKRVGRLYLKALINEKELVLLQTINLSAILDMKWSHSLINSKPVLAVSTSTGDVLLYSLINSGNNFQLELYLKICIGDLLALSLDWSTNKIFSEVPRIVVSDSKGKIHILLVKLEEIIIEQSFKAHDYEAWISAFNYWNPEIIYTGSDDSKMKGYDLRKGCTPIFVNKSHVSGVTSIQSDINKETILANGSYDEIINIWDTRNFKSPISSINVGGGVWRVKWEPNGLPFILAACMHDGFKIIKINKDTGALDAFAKFEKHESIAYGCDWWYGKPCQSLRTNKSIVASVSFYDHLMCLWEFNNEICK